MANEITVTAAQVSALPANGAVLHTFTAGGTITIGNLVYIDGSGYAQHADGNVSIAVATAVGIAVESYDGQTSVASGDPVAVALFGPVSGYSGMTPGSYVYVSDTVGRLSSVAGTATFIVGYALTAGIVFLIPGMNAASSA